MTSKLRRAPAVALALAAVLFVVAALQATERTPAPTIQLNTDEGSPDFATVEVHGLDPVTRARIQRAVLTPDDWPSILAVYTGTELPADAGKPPVAGSWSTSGVLRFRPRYPLVAGLSYVARLDLGLLRRLGDDASDLPQPTVATFSLPKEDQEPSTVVSAVYPTASELPENLLRLYLHFSAPMSRGEATDHIRLLDAEGRRLEGSFLEIDAELWDPRMRRLTLFFDPGRIKRGLRPHLEAGPPLREGGSYRLVIDPGWRDAAGLPLAEGFEKAFTVTAPDRDAPDPGEWRLASPAAASRGPLEILFPEPLDHGLLQRVVGVLDGGGGKPIAGRVEIAGEERLLRFTPDEPWRPGTYAVAVETLLEDLAGNNLRQVFDVDLTAAPRLATEAETVSLPFVVTSP